MRRAILVGLLVLAGCSQDPQFDLPASCEELTGRSLVAALAAAPGEVRVGETRISECFNKNASTGDVQQVGAAMVDAADLLVRDGAAMEAGYLLGAARRGAGETQGVHGELVRRLELAVSPLEDSPRFRDGERAGRDSG